MTRTPASRRICHPASGSAVQWLKMLSEPSSPFRCSPSSSAAIAPPKNSVMIGRPSRRASAHSSGSNCAITASETRLLSPFLKYFSCRRSRLPGQWALSHSPDTGAPEACTDRIPASSNASTAASECAPVRLLCELSTTVVMPASMQPSAVSRLPIYMSAGR
ncbi:hypothetical protein D3C80_1386110 [compost metagenome]